MFQRACFFTESTILVNSSRLSFLQLRGGERCFLWGKYLVFDMTSNRIQNMTWSAGGIPLPWENWVHFQAFFPLMFTEVNRVFYRWSLPADNICKTFWRNGDLRTLFFCRFDRTCQIRDVCWEELRFHNIGNIINICPQAS